MSEKCTKCGAVITDPLEAYGQIGAAMCRACWFEHIGFPRAYKSIWQTMDEWEAYLNLMPASMGVEAEFHNLEQMSRLAPDVAERIQRYLATRRRGDE